MVFIRTKLDILWAKFVQHGGKWKFCFKPLTSRIRLHGQRKQGHHMLYLDPSICSTYVRMLLRRVKKCNSNTTTKHLRVRVAVLSIQWNKNPTLHRICRKRFRIYNIISNDKFCFGEASLAFQNESIKHTFDLRANKLLGQSNYNKQIGYTHELQFSIY